MSPNMASTARAGQGRPVGDTNIFNDDIPDDGGSYHIYVVTAASVVWFSQNKAILGLNSDFGRNCEEEEKNCWREGFLSIP